MEPLLGGGAVQSFGSSAFGLGVTLGEPCEALGEPVGDLAEFAGVGLHAATPHTTRTSNAPSAVARAAGLFMHATVLNWPGLEARLTQLAEFVKRLRCPAIVGASSRAGVRNQRVGLYPATVTAMWGHCAAGY